MSTADIVIQKLRPVIFPIFMIIFAVLLGSVSHSHPNLALGIMGACLYGVCLFVKPIWAYYFMILATLNFLGFATEHFLALPGAFKLRDITLFALFVPIIFDIAVDRQLAQYFKTPMNKYLFCLLGFVMFITVYTCLVYDVSFTSSLRIARKYFFYASFFPFMFLIKTEADFKSTVNVFLFFAVTQAILMIVQFSIGLNVIIMPGLKMEYQQLSGLYLPRIYLRGGEALLALFFGISFWIYQTTKNKKYLYIVFLTGIASFLQFGRASWLKQIIIMLFPLIFTKPSTRIRYLNSTLIFIGAILLISIAAHFTGLRTFELFSKVYEHMQSTFSDFINRTGTFGGRLKEYVEQINLFLQNPIFGVGFLHNIAAEESVKAVIVKDLSVETVDSGLLSLLTTMGIGGVIVFSTLSSAFIFRCIKILRNVSDPYYRGIIFGCFSYFVGGLATFITLPFFTFLYEVPYIIIAFALVEKISQLNQKKNESI